MTKILVIDDEKPLQEEITDWLILEGYETMNAMDGLTGLEITFRHQPDLIICDISMPNLDGHGVLLELRSNPETSGIPFIFMTARASHDDIRRGMDLGADDYITKPFTRRELLHAIHTRLEKKAALDQKREDEISQWQQAFEQEREQRLLKSKLVAMFSHDFRNPLASILSSISLVRDYADRMDEQRRRMHLNRAETSVRQLLQMLDDMLFIAQMENGNLDFKPEAMNIGTFLENIVEEFQEICRETHTINYGKYATDIVMADPRLLRQIMANLISNAIKYSPAGSEIDVLADIQGDECIIRIQDQGIGIPDADQLRLFESFQRASNVGTIQGTGLGLAIVKQAVTLHQGSINLESKPGKGTTITLTLPV